MRKIHAIILGFCIIASVVLFTLFILSLNAENKRAQSIILFFREDCPHCKNVEKFIEESGAMSKLRIERKDVSIPANSLELNKRASQCKIPNEELGVPFIYYLGKCQIGDNSSIEFLEGMMK
jgi:glutaredoxin